MKSLKTLLLVLATCCGLLSCTTKCFNPQIVVTFNAITDSPTSQAVIFTRYVKGSNFATRASVPVLRADLSTYHSDTTVINLNDTLVTSLAKAEYLDWLGFADYDWLIQVPGHSKTFKIRDFEFHNDQLSNNILNKECANSVTYYINDSLVHIERKIDHRTKHGNIRSIEDYISMDFNN